MKSKSKDKKARSLKRISTQEPSLSLPLSGTLLGRRIQEGGFILLCALAIFLLVALMSYHEADPGWSKTAAQINISNAAGKTGAWFSDLFLFLFGYVAFLFPVMIGFGSVQLLKSKEKTSLFNRLLWIFRSVGFILALLSGCGLANLHFASITRLSFGAGGVLGKVVLEQVIPACGYLGSTLLLVAIFLAGITLATGLSWFGLMDIIGKGILVTLKQCRSDGVELWQSSQRWGQKMAAFFKKFRVSSPQPLKENKALVPVGKPKSVSRSTPEKARKYSFEDSEMDLEPTIEIGSGIGSGFDSEIEFETNIPLQPSFQSQPSFQNHQTFQNHQAFSSPNVALLEKPKSGKNPLQFSHSKLESLSREVESRLLEFGVQVNVVGVLPGPVITRFELELAPGIKVSKISGLSKDLARALSVTRVRVVEVIPGKSVVGLEIPNEHRELVCFREILESSHYQEAESPLTLALGKDIAGEPVVVNLAKMPHLLVAGTTGSGKSVGVNAMLLSLLFKASPEEVRLILIDPKMLELSIYDGIPHLLTPVVTDMKDAANVLRWCVGEMERRYQLLAAVGVRNLVGYNQKVIQAEEQNKPMGNPLWRPEMGGEQPILNRLPYVVVIIDEFADMMMVVGKKVEELIARIAQKARAAGIHMILATQRPSVDVITGLIKANVPTRIAFQVSSRIDSRTILDQQGAEQLLGHGDMLYLAPGSGIPIRIHGAFVSDEEVHTVVKALKAMGKPDYAEDILGSGGLMGAVGMGSSPGGYEPGGFDQEYNDGEQDDLYDKAVQIVIESRRASISNLQRRLKIGYNRAARLIDTMETAGVVSAMQSNGGREVLSGRVEE